MKPPEMYEYTRYLAAKRSIDEQSLNLRVWRRFVDRMHQEQECLRLLEIGSGIGSTAVRIISVLDVPEVHYTLVDYRSSNTDQARQNLRNWAENSGYTTAFDGKVLEMHKPNQRCTARFVTADVFDFASAAPHASWNVLIAQAFFDLVNVRAALGHLRPLLTSEATVYFPIHFDGLTAFEPVEQAELNRRVLQAYHDTMDSRPAEYGPSGGSRTGRELILQLREWSPAVLKAGSSDWIVTADGGQFTEQTAYFLYHILYFVETSVASRSDILRRELEHWLSARRSQIQDGSLVFMAHQLDVLAHLG